MGKTIEIVSESYIPPFSFVSSNREIRFELIFKAFDEIFQHPSKYFEPYENDFELYVDLTLLVTQNFLLSYLKQIKQYFLY